MGQHFRQTRHADDFAFNADQLLIQLANNVFAGLLDQTVTGFDHPRRPRSEMAR